ncbi:MaoC family dehydratase [Angustibacter luteus]|uniref:MaoC family dehydratase n=1 Tax=Angustibacter luteus TaxID=658456 RepID=A0ABW1JDI8_9ACTN
MQTITVDDDPSLLALTARGALRRARGDALPDVELARSDVRASGASLAAYSRVCGFTVDGRLPTTYLHVLTFPLQTALMGRPDFPLALPGLVHVENRLELRRPVGVDEALQLAVRAADLRPHSRGRQVDLLSEARVDGELVWRGRSTYLAKQATSPPSQPAQHRARSTSAMTGPPDARWRLPADLGRRYAAVSGDHNPIHLNPLAAKAFGFPRTITHGMWSVARCVSSLAGWGPATGVVEVEFRRPVLLPSTVELRTTAADGGWDLQLSSRHRHGAEPTEHLRCTVRPG